MEDEVHIHELVDDGDIVHCTGCDLRGYVVVSYSRMIAVRVPKKVGTKEES